MKLLANLLCITVLFGPMAAIAMGQPASSQISKTPWGHPDLQGVWNNNT
ncbi:uncharacterized protein METZ01_LOCUS433933, partial [marine metagenome]